MKRKLTMLLVAITALCATSAFADCYTCAGGYDASTTTAIIQCVPPPSDGWGQERCSVGCYTQSLNPATWTYETCKCTLSGSGCMYMVVEAN